jgi:hypothetical protein
LKLPGMCCVTGSCSMSRKVTGTLRIQVLVDNRQVLMVSEIPVIGERDPSTLWKPVGG